MAQSIKRSYTPQQLLENRAGVDAYKFEADAERIRATAAMVDFRFLRGDLHTHSFYSDGKGSVAENWAVAQQRGLDFMFATDHGTVRQKVECRKFKGVWWSQEPGAGAQHIGILDIDRKYTPVKDVERDAQRLREMGAFFFFPHPAGWFPRQWYASDKVDALGSAGPEFAIEVKNGIFRAEPFFDAWEEAYVAIWDRYLSLGRRVIGLAASDAHMPATVGNVWTGVLDARLSKTSVMNGLRSGRVFASSGPAIDLNAASTPMGGTARPRAGKITLRFECADSYGLNWARIIRDGREVKRFNYGGAKHAAEKVTLRVPRSGRYVRVECAANDDRRAYANPIYLSA